MVNKLFVKTNIGVTEARKDLSQLLNRVYLGEEQVVVEKLGIQVAAIISIQDYEEYQRLMAQRRHKDLGRKVGAEAEKQALTEEQLIEELGQTHQQVFRERYAELNQ